MNLTFYLKRILRQTLSEGQQDFTETELLAASKFIVVLAEPGGGKSTLLKSLACQLGTDVVTASLFKAIGADEENIPLVIDAFDEIAKIDKTGIHSLFKNIRIAKPTHIVISSRSSEWGYAETATVEKFLNISPMIVRLVEFSFTEQQAIFEHYMPGEEYAAFRSEIERFDLEALLPNPQFLQMFADAYIESSRHFTDKRRIFALAVECLAKEANRDIPRSYSSLSSTQKIELASEVFTKLLLSGAEGITTIEASESRMYPHLSSVVQSDKICDDILATRLFVPGSHQDQHRPVHKIVAEYCTADYLTQRISDPADFPTLPKCLSIIAPNSVVRDELRGVLGWMAALGNKSVQETTIKLDPYAVFANGDPSQLLPSSKKFLIENLKKIESTDPYFRRGDQWRTFSISGFFTQDILNEIREFLSNKGNGHLRDLLLELLSGSPASQSLTNELTVIILDTKQSEHTRYLASQTLRSLDQYDYRGVLSVLIFEANSTSLHIASEIITAVGLENFNIRYLAGFLRVCANQYPSYDSRDDTAIGSRYYIKQFINQLPLSVLQPLMDELTCNLTCCCSKNSYECFCLNGISKIVGSMLDRYFEIASPPFNPVRVWEWTGNLNFNNQNHPNQCQSIKTMRQDDNLRQGIIAYILGTVKDRKVIYDIKVRKFQGYFHSHAGLHMLEKDYQFILDMTYELNNVDLWASFIPCHQYNNIKEKIGPNELRQLARLQANSKPEFMKEWACFNKAMAKLELENQGWKRQLSRGKKRRKRRQDKIRENNKKYITNNRQDIANGRDWASLIHFSELVLMAPARIKHEFDDKTMIRNALRNCLNFIRDSVPDLSELAKLQCESKRMNSETVLYAACLEIFRGKGNLESVDLPLLQAFKTNIRAGFSAVSKEEREALENEINRLVFSEPESAENFLRQYLEPQLSQPCANPELWLLSHDEPFQHLHASLSTEWLKRFPSLTIDALQRLFNIALQYGLREDVIKIIAERCSDIMDNNPELTNNETLEKKRLFWLVRAFYFLDEIPDIYWQWLTSNKDNLLRFSNGRMSYRDNQHWPDLNASKIRMVLDVFVEKWPKVDLPNNWGTDSPQEEKAYRLLTDLVWSIESSEPDDALPVLEKLLRDPRLTDFHKDMQSIHAGLVRKKALRDFEPPTVKEIKKHLDEDEVVTVEALRQRVMQELEILQEAINGGEFNTVNLFYDASGAHLKEVRSTEIIAERLSMRLESYNIIITPEHQLKDKNRSDFTAAKLINGKRRLLVAEVKGQWHSELYTAAACQLHERYSIHPDAEQQGIYLVLWFGRNVGVAGRKRHDITDAKALKSSIVECMPADLLGLIDVFVLDLTKERN
ncbi:NACHT domain-containing protein [Photorhabdus tasmaniensis]|uniref:AAA+ ATPase domain-containing protein n=1 Tax=Photorhabdus tasmaniensis TaxID=1004159 RepID=A0ABX0GMU4_9GAMM|nr:hypothetical protein [Photorhabdus tasmaniensis]NHB89832.1 hypothetical protein [Photorhabdus tasmaniensis]